MIVVNVLCSPTSALEVGKEINAEPPGQGTEESLEDNDTFIVEKTWGYDRGASDRGSHPHGASTSRLLNVRDCYFSWT
jgi:hypothetical protein